MVTETFCTPIDPWRAHAIGMYPFAACVALVMRIFTVCCDDLCSQIDFPWGALTEFRQPLQVQSHLEMPGILVQLGHIQRT